MYYESAPNNSYVVQPKTQVYTAYPTYTPPQSSIRYLPNNGGQRALQISPFVRTPVHFDQNQMYESSNSSIIDSNRTVQYVNNNQQQPILIVNNLENKSSQVVPNKPLKIEKIRVIGNHEKEFFRDGVKNF